MTTKDIIKDAEREFEKVANGIFLHGKQTPEQSYSLPEGQYTVQETIDHFHNTFTTLIQQLITDIEGMEAEEVVQVNDDGTKVVKNSGMVRIDNIINHLKEMMG